MNNEKNFFAFRLIGPITSKLATFYVFLMKLFFSLIPLTLSEMMLVKCLYILKWSSMAMVDDNLIATVIFRTNVLLSGLFVLPGIVLEDGSCNEFYKVLAGQPNFQVPTETCMMSNRL